MDRALRRARLAERLAASDLDALLVTSRSNVRYLTGFSGSSGQLLVTVDPSRAVLLTDGRYDEQSRREVEGLERRVSPSGFVEQIVDVLEDLRIGRVGFEAGDLTHERYVELSTAAAAEMVRLDGAVEELRLAKDPQELERIEAAQASAEEAFDRVVLGGGLHEGVAEREVALELEIHMRRAGADEPAFASIVAFGENAAEPHHEPTRRPLARGDVVKIDFGAAVDGYRSDMTRTVAFGEPGERIRELHGLVLDAQLAAIAAVRAGAAAGDVDAAARGVIEGSGLGDAFVHPVGHGVGLEIHERPIMRPGLRERLVAGAVVTVEPGVYISGVGGVRIEDMVRVTGDGARVIASTSKELIVV